jgi:ADP-heptose:LPS heptosyltransferase
VDIPFAAEPDLIALHLWASGQRSWLREWPKQRWVELAQRLAGSNTLFLITGAPSDRERIDPFVAQLRAAGLRAEPFVSPDGFRTLTHVLRRAQLVVSVNTGVMHLAAIAGAPTVAINGPNRNGRWGPIGPHAVGVEAPGIGCGYLHLGFEFEGNPTDCMERTSVDQVYAAAQTLLSQQEVPRCSA